MGGDIGYHTQLECCLGATPPEIHSIGKGNITMYTVTPNNNNMSWKFAAVRVATAKSPEIPMNLH